MRTANVRNISVRILIAGCAFGLFATSVKADLSPSQARKALTKIPGFELKSGAVRVKSVSGSSTEPIVSAELRTVFKFETDQDGKWRVAEIRTGQDRWEKIDAIAMALKTSSARGDCNAPDPPLRNRTPSSIRA